jgi:hypothetical protein
MTVYTVHEPRPRKGDGEPNPDRFVFVRDGFYVWAFLLGPLWMLWHRMWLVLLGYLTLTIAIQVGLTALGTPGGARLAVGVLIALLIGIEAASLRRFSLRRWRNRGVVVASDKDSAERRFFDLWAAQGVPDAPQAAPVAAPPSETPPRAPQTSTEVMGLFPEPQSRS